MKDKYVIVVGRGSWNDGCYFCKRLGAKVTILEKPPSREENPGYRKWAV